MSRLIAVVPLSALILLGGCAFTKATLNVGYTDAMAARGPLSTVTPRRVEVGAFADKRPEIERIGYKRNMYGQKTADIVTTKPVPEIVREALATEFRKNGHDVTSAERDLVVSGEITTFWFEFQINFWTVEFFGTSAVTLNLVDGRTGATLLTRNYQGHYTEKSGGGLDATWERVMNEALQRMVREVSSDLQLIRVLQAEREAPSRADSGSARR
jgi:uncharacterized lipoprotein YajG